jgi:hypothetical protein
MPTSSAVAEYCVVHFVYKAIRLLPFSYEVVQKPCAYNRMKVKHSTHALQSLPAYNLQRGFIQENVTILRKIIAQKKVEVQILLLETDKGTYSQA